MESPVHLLTYHSLAIAIGLLVYVVTAHLSAQRRYPTAAIAWVLFIALLPYAALPVLLLFGSRKLARPRLAPEQRTTTGAKNHSWVLQTIHALGQPAPATYRALQIHADGREALDALLRTIDGACHSIDVCTFILGPDRVGHEVMQRLGARAREGVRVRLLLDGMGSLMAGRPKLDSLQAAGVQISLFVPPLRSSLKGRMNLRNHRKVVVVDAGHECRRLWSGGRNLASEYFSGDADKAAWHDLSYDLAGALVLQAAAIFERDWAFSISGHPVAPPLQEPLTEAATGQGAHGAQLIASGPDQIDDTVYALLLSAIYQAHRRIVIVTPYFVPDSALQMALGLAARRGVEVDVLLPARSNHGLSDLARGRALCALDEAGARIWLAPQMLHAKLVLIDQQLALAGSANFDSRSLFLNYEAMMAFHEASDVGRFTAWFEHERRSATRYIARPPGIARDLLEGMVLWIGFQL